MGASLLTQIGKLLALVGLVMALTLALPDTTHATSLNEVAKVVAFDGEAGDIFGRSVALSGDTAVVGAAFADHTASSAIPLPLSDAGAAYLFERDHGGTENWGAIKKLTASDGWSSDFFGANVSISGDAVVVGAVRARGLGLERSGAAYVFHRDQGGTDNWGEVRKLTSQDGEAEDGFGRGVAISGDVAVIGAPFEDAAGELAGAAYVFGRNEGGVHNWGEVKKLLASDAEALDYFGVSVALSGDIVIVGAFREDVAGNSAGAAYVFQQDEGGVNNWGQVAKLTASDTQAGDEFGINVALTGDTAVVGAWLADAGVDDNGAAYIFERNEGGVNTWGEVAKLTASDIQPGLEFGGIVAVSGNTVIVGAHRENSDGALAGAAYVFERDQGGPGAWGEVAKLIASDAASNDTFGEGVSISASTAIVGAPQAGGLSSGIESMYVFDLLLQKPTPTSTPPPGPLAVGGIALDSDLRTLALEATGPHSSPWSVALGIGATACFALGAFWCASKRFTG